MVYGKLMGPCLMLALVGCVTTGNQGPDRPFAGASDPFSQAVPYDELSKRHPGDRQEDVWFLNGDHRPLPESVITVLQPLDEEALPDDSIPSSKAVVTARDTALQEPVASTFVGAAAVHPFVEGAVYKIHTAPGSSTTIALQAGETINEIAAGETSRWSVTQSYSGSGELARPILFIKPLQPNLSNNMTIATDRRLYHLDLQSHPEGRYQTEISWRYPDDDWKVLTSAPSPIEASAAAAPAKPGTSVDLGQLDFSYAITSMSRRKPDWFPVRAFHDGAKTYIQFPPNITTRPPLFVIKGRESEIVNFRLQGDTYVVDRVLDIAELRIGEDDQTVVRVTRQIER